MKDEIITDPTEIKRIINVYYRKLYGCIFDKFYEIDQFLKRHKLLKLTKKYITQINPYLLKKLNFIV